MNKLGRVLLAEEPVNCDCCASKMVTHGETLKDE